MPQSIPDLFDFEQLKHDKPHHVNEQFQQHMTQAKEDMQSDESKTHIHATFVLAQVAIYSYRLHGGNNEFQDFRFSAMKSISQYIMQLSEELKLADDYESELLVARIKATAKIIMDQLFKDPENPTFKHDEYTLNLSHINLSNQKLYDIDLRQAHLTGAVFSGANMAGANLSGASLYKSAFVETNLLEANLAYAQLIRSDLTRANLTRANLDHTYLNQADLTEADLTRANVSIAVLTDVKLNQTMLTGGRWQQTSMNVGDFSGADLTGADLSHIDLNHEFLQEVIMANFNVPATDKIDIVHHEYLKNGVFDITYQHNADKHNFHYHIGGQKVITEDLLLTFLTNFSYWKVRITHEIEKSIEILEKHNFVSMGWSKEFRKFKHSPGISELQEIYKLHEFYDYKPQSKSRLNRFCNIQLNDVLVIPHPNDENKVRIGRVLEQAIGFDFAMERDGVDPAGYEGCDIGLVVKIEPGEWVNVSDIAIPETVTNDIWKTDSRSIIRFNKIKPVLETYLK